MNPTIDIPCHDIVLIGGGIMSATLGVLLKELDPALPIVMFETLDDCAQESSGGWNTTGTRGAAQAWLRLLSSIPH